MVRFRQQFRLFFLALLFILGSSEIVAQTDPVDGEGVLLITEVYYDTPGDDSREEWFEITNVGTAVLPLTGIRIGDAAQSGGVEGMKRFPEGTQIGPLQSLVIAQTAVGFRALFGFNPHFEMIDTDDRVPDLLNSRLWATGEVALANDGDELLLLQETAVIDAVNYGDKTTFFAPSVADVFRGQSIERVPGNCDTNTAADWQPARTPTPGTVTFDETCAPVSAASLETLPTIGEIQGDADVSPYVNQIVSFRGVVTGRLADRNAKGITFYTLFVQDPPGMADGNPNTSDGIALFLGQKRPSYHVGDLVRVTGQVTEFFGYTEIDDDQLDILVEGENTPLPDAVHWEWANTSPQALEALESMLVVVPGSVPVVGATFASCALVTAETDQRFYQRSEEAPAGFVLPVMHTGDVDCGPFPQVKVGDRLSHVQGPLIYHFDQFKVVQQDAAALTVEVANWPERPLPIRPESNQITVATLNLENFFDGVDDTGQSAEPKLSVQEIADKEEKLVRLIYGVLGCPTLLGVQEVEKQVLLEGLADSLQSACGFRYQISHRDSPDARGIDVALLSRPDRVEVQTVQLQQVCTALDTGIEDPAISCLAGEQPLFSRPPLQVDVLVDERPFTLFINHLKSKREGALETAPRRLAQAGHINTLVAELLAADVQTNVVVMGDFNDYEQSGPLRRMMGDGQLTNPLFQLSESQRYSFVFGGVAQLIDGILLSPALAEMVVAQTIFHVNADFPFELALDVSDQAAFYRASDHDVPLILIELAEEARPVVETAVSPPLMPDPTPIDLPPPVNEDNANWRYWIIGVIGFGILAGTFFLKMKTNR